jgi:hypothetical protein
VPRKGQRCEKGRFMGTPNCGFAAQRRFARLATARCLYLLPRFWHAAGMTISAYFVARRKPLLSFKKSAHTGDGRPGIVEVTWFCQAGAVR